MLNQKQIQFNKALTAYLLNRHRPVSADLILGRWQDLRNDIKNAAVQTTPISVSFKGDFDFSRLKKISYKYSVINFLKEEITKEIGQFIKAFFLQGSFGTGDFLENWSDLDIMIIFNDELFKTREGLILTRKVLRKFSPLFYKIDPLSHHRFHLATSLDLNYYPQIILPLIAYQNGLWLAGEREFEVRLRDDFFEKTQDLLSRAKHFEKRLQFPPKNMVELKLDLSHLFLLPSLLLQIKGIYLYKRFSFERAKKEFPRLDFSVIDEASALRERWPAPPKFLKYCPNCLISPYAYYLRKSKPPISDEEIKRLTKRSYELFESACQLKI